MRVGLVRYSFNCYTLWPAAFGQGQLTKILAPHVHCRLDVDKFVSTELHLGLFYLGEWEKILLFAGNSSISSPLVFIALGKIYLSTHPGQSAGNFRFSTKAKAVTKNTYNNYQKLPRISEHVPEPANLTDLTDNEFGYFLAGLIEGDGWFGKMHCILFLLKTIYLWLI